MNKEQMIEKFKELFPNLWNDSYRVSFVRDGILILYPGPVNKRAYTFVYRRGDSYSLSFG